MAITGNQTRVLTISDNQLVLESIESALKRESDFILLDNNTLADGIIETIEDKAPHIILLDYQFNRDIYDLIDEIASKFPTSAVVVILPESEVQNSNRVVLAGARAFMLHPFSQINLISTLRRVKELVNRMAPAPAKPQQSKEVKRQNNTIVVFSPKGGVGTSTVAINLAIALHQELDAEVLLLDGKHLFGHIPLMLNLRSANSISDLIAHLSSLEESLIRQIAVDHTSGIKVIPSPSAIAEGQGIRPENLYKAILALQNTFSNIVVDGGSFLNECAVTYMDSAFRIVLVITPDLAALRDARKFMDLTRSLAYPRSKTLLLLNMDGRKNAVQLDEIEKVLGRSIFGKVPADETFALNCLNEGIPMMLKKSNHSVSKAFKKIAQNLEKTLTEDRDPSVFGGDRISDEELDKISRLG